MTYLAPTDVSVWADGNKLQLSTVDASLETSVATQVLSRIGTVTDVSTWINAATTPKIVLKIMAMIYVGWYFERTYSEDQEANSYGLLLMQQADKLLEGIVAGEYDLPGVADIADISNPIFYPTDHSSAVQDTDPAMQYDSSLGGPKFSMGTIW